MTKIVTMPLKTYNAYIILYLDHYFVFVMDNAFYINVFNYLYLFFLTIFDFVIMNTFTAVKGYSSYI